MEYIINLVEQGPRSYINSKILGLLLGYGAKNAEKFDILDESLMQERDNSMIQNTLEEIFQGKSSFVRPPAFSAWDDEEGETSALYTHYLNESLDMSETVLKPAFRNNEFDKKAAVQAFFDEIFEPQSH
jgi:hypothetical protein